MRFSCLLAIVLAFGLCAGVSAQNGTCKYKFQVPFTFVGYDTDFPAGEYDVSLLPMGTSMTVVKFAASDMKTAPTQLIQARPGKQVRLDDGKAYLVFQKLGTVYLLKEYRDGLHSTAMRTPLSKERQFWERSYIAKHVHGEYVLIGAP